MEGIVKFAETSGILFVITLLICMMHAGAFIKFLSAVCAILFVASIILILLQRYTNNIEDHGYDIL